MNSDAQAFLNTLPKWLREDILQSGAEFTTKDELEAIARNFTSKLEKPQTEN